MLMRTLGKSKIRVSCLGYGCMRLPLIDGDEGRIDEDAATRQIHAAIDQGVNYIDTAYPYHKGTSEPFVGRALKGSYRSKVHLATKLPSWLVQETGDLDRLLNEQLERLQVKKIDFYLLHALKREWWHRLKDLGVREFLDGAIRDGRIQCAGFSFHDELGSFKEIVDSYDWTFCQIQYNYMDENMQAGRAGLTYAAEKGMGVVVMEPLRGGKLALEGDIEFKKLWKMMSMKRSPAEWALLWVWNHPEVSVALSGMNSMEQVNENCRVANEAVANSLNEADLSILNRIKDQYRERIKIACTGCGYCMPCPEGVNIPRIFSIYNDRHIYGDKRWAHLTYVMTTNSSELATHCVECGACEEACPQKLSIREMLKESHQVLSNPEF